MKFLIENLTWQIYYRIMIDGNESFLKSSEVSHHDVFKPEMTHLDILVPFSVRIIQWGLGYYKEYYKWVICSGWESPGHLWQDHPLLRWFVRNLIPWKFCNLWNETMTKYSPVTLIVTLKVYSGTFPLYSTTMLQKFKLMESQLSWRCGILLVRRSLIGWGHFPIQIRVSHSYE